MWLLPMSTPARGRPSGDKGASFLFPLTKGPELCGKKEASSSSYQLDLSNKDGPRKTHTSITLHPQGTAKALIVLTWLKVCHVFLIISFFFTRIQSMGHPHGYGDVNSQRGNVSGMHFRRIDKVSLHLIVSLILLAWTNRGQWRWSCGLSEGLPRQPIAIPAGIWSNSAPGGFVFLCVKNGEKVLSCFTKITRLTYNKRPGTKKVKLLFRHLRDICFEFPFFKTDVIEPK